MTLPLDGVLVLDLSRLLPGPFCATILADFGADVVKVEDPGMGDLVRLLPPFMPGGGGESARFLVLNRNRRGLTVNLKHDRGKEVLRRLARRADVLLEGFRPGVLDRLGVGYPALRRENPRLVWCASTGYGQDGPRRDRAGHDLNYMGYAGALALGGARGGPPVPRGVQVADLSGALYAAIGILLALRARDRTGDGQLVDVAMQDAALSLTAIHAAPTFAGAPPSRRGEFELSGGRPSYGVYETADGRHLALGAVEPKFWQAFCDAVARPDLVPANLAEGDEAARARSEVAAIVRARPLAEWLAVFERVEACVSPVLEIEEALEDEQAIARGMRRALPHPTLGLIQQIGPAIRLSATPGELRRPPPGLGEHTDEVLREVGGYTDGEIADLRAAGAI